MQTELQETTHQKHLHSNSNIVDIFHIFDSQFLNSHRLESEGRMIPSAVYHEIAPSVSKTER